MASSDQSEAQMSQTVTRSLVRITFDRTYPGHYREDFFNTVADDVTGRVLDLGAGGGGTHDRWNLPNADEVIGIDIGDYSGITARADGTQLPFEAETFDSVISSAVSEHVSYTDLVEMMQEINRVLKPEGKLYAAVAFNYPLHGEPHDYHRPTIFGLERLCENHGLEVESVYSGGSFIDTLLHVLFHPFRLGLMSAGKEHLTQLFALIHYPLKLLSIVVARLLYLTLGRNPWGSRWYLMNGIVATKRE